MKYILLVFFGFSFVCSQTPIEKFEYERKNQLVTSFSFKINTCPKQVIFQTWKTMVETNSGKISLIDKVFEAYSASGVVFPSLSNLGVLNMYFKVFDYKADSIIVSNAFQKVDGQYVLPDDKSFATTNAMEIMLDFSFETRKNCANYELTEAMKYAEDLNRKIYVLENQNIYLDKNIISSHKKIQKLDLALKTLNDQVLFYEKSMQKANDEFTKSKLDEQKIMASEKINKSNDRLEAENALIKEYRLKKEANLDTIKALKTEINSQMLVIEDLQRDFQKVIR